MIRAILVAACAALFATASVAQPAPAPTLLLPYFETSLTNDDWSTSFTISNASGEERIAKITLWSDRGYSIIWFWDVLQAHETRQFRVSDMLGNKIGFHGSQSPKHPDCVAGHGPSPVFDEASCLLTVGRGPAAHCVRGDAAVGMAHAHAIGFITVDVIGDCTPKGPEESPAYFDSVADDAVFTGTFELRAAGAVVAAGPLVAIPIVHDAPRTFYQRFSSGRDHRGPLPSSVTVDLPSGGAVDIHVWRDPAFVSCVDISTNRKTMSVTTIRTRRTARQRRVTLQATGDHSQIAVVVAKAAKADPDAAPIPNDRVCQNPPIF